ncbi:protein-disulfide reductase DsbD [Burkholderia cenocepacia]|uniref:Thiol:disulfide interchange protein DsbD n=1 Tax=Burkholderia cenocepacia (strain ATCC BAA-245 / DSM 16553 / LMG 16656 / NCTC 13227 / J2315 / CF5610) TaxID=216591 RepID=B4E5E9_BURCJ|nr:protein-disulfide reductase DsbD [Burkholderia cenocepacia]KIS48664.1 cytochrome C biogenesis transmembrane region family protein [Burkholderia cepacia]KKI82173.1 thiol:disulfide interchange protein [Burkholderia cenocepacia]MBR8387522.1 protein-disulfide reductase DsbD [Burkholderia cenocepacia]MCW3660139.1 protein-disulfide reductase DsbD [Burkholderia cenocepacia]MDS0804687.1 protein-disulfide reductase DsbD [Burkholderia cenocepacia]
MFNGMALSVRVRALRFVAVLLSFVFVLGGLSVARAADDFLDPSVAFKFSASESPGQVDVRFKIANGYYMYRERFAFAVKSGQATLGEPQFPAGHVKFDQTFQKDVETYRDEVVVHVPVKQAAGPFELAVTSQGCADEGICYPPAEHVMKVDGAALGAASSSGDTAAAGSWFDKVTSADFAQSLLEGHGFFTIVALYFVAGVVLSLLPCSYPMIPIVSAIIIGQGTRATHARGFALSLTYVVGMALVYTVLGIAAALVGQSLGAWLQNPWVLGAFGVLLTAFAVSLISGKDIALPERWQNGAAEASSARQGGHFVAVAAMGALSALVVGACMTAPLFAVLAFIAHTGNALLGGAALFAMGLGLGVPLLVVGVGAGTVLPRAGAWMDGVKVFFGIVLLAAALWIVWPVLAGGLKMVLAALWLLIAAAALGLFTPNAGAASIWRRLGRGVGAALAIWAATLLVGLAAGSTDPVKPLAVLAARTVASGGAATAGAAAADGPAFAPVRSSGELDALLKTSGRPVMLDFYADWCVSCKEMEHLTFTDARVQARLARLHLVRADVTANNPDDQALLKRFNLFGPPGIIFFDRNGNEIGRVVGYQAADTFLRSLDRAAVPTV